MSEGLFKILASAEGIRPPAFTFDDIASWPEGELERCLGAGLLHPGRPASFVTCLECGETEEVVVVEDSVTKRPHAYMRCAEVGPVEIPLERLRQWETTYEQLMDAVFSGIPLVGSREEIVRDRVWRLGAARWAGAARNVYFVRGLRRRDAWRVINQAKLTPRSVVFVPARLPEEDQRIKVMPFVIPLTSVLSWEAGSLRFDHEYVEAEVSDAVARLDGKSERRRRPAPRAARLTVIAALSREMQDHLRAARDHALDALARTGVPQLLPRPQKDFLARKLGVHKSSVTRAFHDEEARELRFLWELAADLDRILERSGCGT